MIRKLEPKDIEVVNKYLKEFNYKIDETLNEFVNVLLYDDNGIKGVLVYSKIYDRLEIDYIIVDKSYRRLGIASKLLKYMEDENKGALNITLEVRESNDLAISFYKKNGFVIEAVRKKYYKDENGLLMMKKFGE